MIFALIERKLTDQDIEKMKIKEKTKNQNLLALLEEPELTQTQKSISHDYSLKGFVTSPKIYLEVPKASRSRSNKRTQKHSNENQCKIGTPKPSGLSDITTAAITGKTNPSTLAKFIDFSEQFNQCPSF